MADWLEQTFGDELWPSDEDTFGAVIAYLRAVPTDAQKIEEATIDKMEIRANAARLEAHAGAGADEE